MLNCSLNPAACSAAFVRTAFAKTSCPQIVTFSVAFGVGAGNLILFPATTKEFAPRV